MKFCKISAEVVRNELGIPGNHNGQFRAKRAHGCEIRFVTEAQYFDIGLTAAEADVQKLPKRRFAPYVWRIQFGMNGYLYFHYLDTYGYAHRPPNEKEKPEILWAAYGSSITCGSVTTLYSNSYVEQAALYLGYDVMNKGLSGSCMCEPEIADYLASLPVDELSLELEHYVDDLKIQISGLVQMRGGAVEFRGLMNIS